MPPRYHASPTIDGLGEGVPTDKGGKFPLDLNLESLTWAVRVDGHAMNKCTEALHQRSPVVLRLGVVYEARSQRIHRFGIAVEGRRVKRNDFRGLFERRDLSFDTESLAGERGAGA